MTDSQANSSRLAESTTERRPSVVVDDVRVTFTEYAVSTPASGPRRLFGKAPTARKTRKIHALRGITFTAYEGESIGILGRNGSGKSTLMSVIAGLLSPTSGSVFAQSSPTHLGINAAFVGDLTGTQNVVLGGLAMGLDRPQIERSYDSIVEFSGIGEFVDLPMRTYSSGMAARLKFSIATTVNHQILIIDEALSVGDEGFNRVSRKRIEEMRSAAGTVFLVSHSLQQVRETCDRAIWIEAGEIVMDGPVDVVSDAYHLVQSGRANIADARARASVADTPAAAARYEKATVIRPNDPAGALRLLREAIDLHIDPPPWWIFDAAECAGSVEDFEAARELLEAGIERKLEVDDLTNLSRRYHQLGWVYGKLGRTDEARAANATSAALGLDAN